MAFWPPQKRAADGGDPFGPLADAEPQAPTLGDTAVISPTPPDSQPTGELEPLRAQVEQLQGTIEELQTRLERQEDSHTRAMEAVEQKLRQLEQDCTRALEAETEARQSSLEELQRMLATREAELVPPEPLAPLEPDPEEPPNELASRAHVIQRELACILQEAPARLGKTLDSTYREVVEIATALATPGNEDDFNRLATTLVPEVVELCDGEEDTGSAFFDGLEGRLDQLIEAAGLEIIRPQPGSAYQPAEHNAIRVVRTDDASLRDKIERCVGRGFRRDGKLLKKAEVTVYL